MATVFEWYKATLEFLKGNKVLLLLATSFIASLSTNIYQARDTTTPKIVVEKSSCGCINNHEKEHH